jgi:hypothetical protein
VKVNVDGAFRAADGNGGGGVVIRDHHDGFVSGANHFFPTLLMPKVQSCWRVGGVLLWRELPRFRKWCWKQTTLELLLN